MFKKQFGIPNTRPYGNYATDAAIPTTSINNCLLDKQYSQEIPKRFPTDIIEDSNFNLPNPQRLYNSNSKRFISISKPYMVYYQDIQMLNISDESFHAGTYDANNNIRFYLTQNAISPFYGNDPNIDNSEKYYDKLIVSGANISNTEVTTTTTTEVPRVDANGNLIADQDGNQLYDTITTTTTTTVPIVIGYTTLTFGDKVAGNWLLDCDTGVLTFYDNVNPSRAIVNTNYPQRISFWRYEGLIGNSSIVNVGEY
jgi:hypothetical protein